MALKVLTRAIGKARGWMVALAALALAACQQATPIPPSTLAALKAAGFEAMEGVAKATSTLDMATDGAFICTTPACGKLTMLMIGTMDVRSLAQREGVVIPAGMTLEQAARARPDTVLQLQEGLTAGIREALAEDGLRTRVAPGRMLFNKTTGVARTDITFTEKGETVHASLALIFRGDVMRAVLAFAPSAAIARRHARVEWAQ